MTLIKKGISLKKFNKKEMIGLGGLQGLGPNGRRKKVRMDEKWGCASQILLWA